MAKGRGGFGVLGFEGDTEGGFLGRVRLVSSPEIVYCCWLVIVCPRRYLYIVGIVFCLDGCVSTLDATVARKRVRYGVVRCIVVSYLIAPTCLLGWIQSAWSAGRKQ